MGKYSKVVKDVRSWQESGCRDRTAKVGNGSYKRWWLGDICTRKIAEGQWRVDVRVCMS